MSSIASTSAPEEHGGLQLDRLLLTLLFLALVLTALTPPFLVWLDNDPNVRGPQPPGPIGPLLCGVVGWLLGRATIRLPSAVSAVLNFAGAILAGLAWMVLEPGPGVLRLLATDVGALSGRSSGVWALAIFGAAVAIFTAVWARDGSQPNPDKGLTHALIVVGLTLFGAVLASALARPYPSGAASLGLVVLLVFVGIPTYLALLQLRAARIDAAATGAPIPTYRSALKRIGLVALVALVTVALAAAVFGPKALGLLGRLVTLVIQAAALVVGAISGFIAWLVTAAIIGVIVLLARSRVKPGEHAAVATKRTSIFSPRRLRDQLRALFAGSDLHRVRLTDDPAGTREAMVFLQALAYRRGEGRGEAETAADFTRRLAQGHPASRDPLASLRTLYEETRYGETEAQRQAARDAWRAIRRDLEG